MELNMLERGIIVAALRTTKERKNEELADKVSATIDGTDLKLTLEESSHTIRALCRVLEVYSLKSISKFIVSS